MSERIKITINKFKNWQRDTDKRRTWIALDCHFFDDPKIYAVMEELPDSVFCYLWLLMNADENGVLEMPVQTLKKSLKKILNKGNRFDILKHLEPLSNASLIELLLQSNTPLESDKDWIRTELEPDKEFIRGALEGPEIQQYINTTEVHTNNTNKTNNIYCMDSKKDEINNGQNSRALTQKKYSEPFKKAWKIYPRKEGKAKAFKHWKSNHLDPSVEQVISSIEQYKKTDQWKDPKFIPHFSTFLNEQRYEGFEEVGFKQDSEESFYDKQNFVRATKERLQSNQWLREVFTGEFLHTRDVKPSEELKHHVVLPDGSIISNDAFMYYVPTEDIPIQN